MPAQRLSHRAQAQRVVCIRCGSQMQPALLELKSTYGIRFSRQTFDCGKCGHKQTYTQGRRGWKQPPQ